MKTKIFSFIEIAFLATALLLLDTQYALGAETPKEIRIAAVAYSSDGKTGFNGSAGVVEKEGWLRAELEKKNIKLTWVPIPAQSVATTINEDFANHSIDFAGYGDLPSVILNAGGIDTRLIVPGGRGNNVYLVVPPGSTAKSILDLKGKRIALHRGRPWEVTFGRLLSANGLKITDFKISNLNPVAGAAALAAGNVDAFVTLSDAYTLEDKKLGKIIWSTKVQDQDWKMRAELWGAKAFIDQNPELTQIVATAFVKAAYWTSQDANFEDYIKIASLNGQPEGVLRREYSQDAVTWKSRWSPLFDGLVTQHYREVAAYSKQSGLIRTELNTDKLFDQRFLTNALKSLSLESYWSASAGTKPSLRS
jgi:sulfonate transport system substrate-binding protein